MVNRGVVIACALSVLTVTGGLTAATAHAALPPPAVAHRPTPTPEPSPSSEPSPSRTEPTEAEGADGEGPKAEGVDGELEKVRKRIEELHGEAGSATDAYNAAVERAERQERALTAANRRVKRNKSALKELRDRAGAMARAQYRSGGLPASTRLALAEDPEEFLRSLGLLRKGQRATSGVMTDLGRLGASLEDDREAAAERHTALEKTRKERGTAKREVEAKLEKAQKLESSLAAEERARLKELEERTAHARQLRWLRTGVLEEIDGEAGKRGKKAIAFALAQIGKDYEWGAEGPETFDCSGLTLRAWEAAGVTVPRTSQEQWRQLTRVDITDMRPGDLIIYKEDASHVGLYIGDGDMVHAPRTGRQIRVEGAGALPILGVVRPDA
ncbi:C40 family peptidase [Streptomyces sp. GSL17-111]|uniref:C40 family peptidase n=1 Tax=Streptomyces sp. GSL17-111 TaxID=3121596 RepID=UPI0030F3DE67